MIKLSFAFVLCLAALPVLISAINTCMPDALTAEILLQENYKLNFFEAYNAVDYKLMKQRFRINAGIAGGRNISNPVDIYDDYTTRTRWVASDAVQWCQATKMDDSQSLQQCVDAKVLAPAMFAGKVVGNLYGFTNPKDTLAYVFGMAAVDNSLVFLSNPNVTMTYFDFVAGPVSSTQFVPPAYCTKTKAPVRLDADMADLMVIAREFAESKPSF